MLIGLCGGKSRAFNNVTPQSVHPSNSSPGICAGKRSVADYLVREHGFYAISLEKCPGENTGKKPAFKGSSGLTEDSAQKDLPFSDIDALLDFVTRRWRERWVIKDIWDESILDALLRRPFFLLISVDAPVTVRWNRYSSR